MHEKNSETIHVALAVHDPKGTYSRHAGVVMTSMFENTKSKICVHLLHDDTLSDENREKLSHIARKYAQDIEYIDVKETINFKTFAARHEHVLETLTIGTLFRLVLPSVLKEDKVIYLDCDIVVELDIRELWELDITDLSLAVCVLDEPTMKFIRNYKVYSAGLIKMGIELDKCFNAGVLVMNLSKIRKKHDLLELARDFFEKFGEMAFAGDQDMLNKLFQNDCLFIDRKYNLWSGEMFDKVGKPDFILHFYGGVQPWKEIRSFEADRFYWKYLQLSEWGTDIAAEIFAMIEKNGFYHKHGSECVKRLKTGIIYRIKNLFKKNRTE